jgi:tetratricopeptide (TPR) repeat protein
MRALAAGDEDGAFAQLSALENQPDAEFVAGLLALKRGDAARATALLERAAAAADLGAGFARYHIAFDAEIPITEEVAAAAPADRKGAWLALSEARQRLGQYAEATAALRELLKAAPDDVGVRLALSELLTENDGGEAASREVLALAQGVTNDSLLHAALLLYRARACAGSTMWEGAKEAAAAALRKRAGRPPELLRAARYEYALALDWVGEKKRARAEWEKLYAAYPDYKDVAAKAGAPRPAP